MTDKPNPHMITLREYKPLMRRMIELTMPEGFLEEVFAVCNVEKPKDPKRQKVTLSRWGDEVMMKMPELPGTPYVTLWEPEIKMIEQFHDVTWEELPDIEGDFFDRPDGHKVTFADSLYKEEL